MEDRARRVAMILGIGAAFAASAARGATIYGDAFAATWDASYSYSTTVGAADATHVHGGAAAIRVDVDAAYGALGLRTSAPVSTSGFTAVRFWVYAAGQTALALYTQSADSGGESTPVAVTATNGAWKQVEVSLAALGSPATIARINLADDSNSAGWSFWVDDVELVAASGGPLAYVTESRTIVSSGIDRDILIAKPSPLPATPLPLVFSLHGDGGSGPAFRNAMPIEANSTSPGAVFVYPTAPDNNTFGYWNYDGRSREAVFVQNVISALHAELGIDIGRVYVVGMSGGATMANALGCWLGPNVIHGLGIHSGSLYPVPDGLGHFDFEYTNDGGVTCPLPASILLWGKADNGQDTSYAGAGLPTRDNYVATQGCAATTHAWSVDPCVSYDGCGREVTWCAIDGLGHAIWPGAANAIWTVIAAASPISTADFESGDLSQWTGAAPP